MLSGLEITFETWLAAAALAGLAGMDDTSWPQVMASRPLVAGAAGGWLLGDVVAGVAAGALLELVILRHLPFGGARCPDPGPAGLVAGAAAAGSGAGGVAVTAAAATAGWAVGWLGQASVRLQRRLAARLVTDAEALSGAPAGLVRRHRLLTAADFARGALLGAAFLVPAVVGVRAAAAAGAGTAPTLLLAGGAALAGGAGSASFSSSRRAGLLVVAGGAAGLLAVGLAP